MKFKSIRESSGQTCFLKVGLPKFVNHCGLWSVGTQPCKVLAILWLGDHMVSKRLLFFASVTKRVYGMVSNVCVRKICENQDINGCQTTVNS